jgi:hypothetical protein
MVDTDAEAAARVLASDPRFAGIGPLRGDIVGQSAWYEVVPDRDGYLVAITVGWGDCMAGCIERHVWEIAVASDGTIDPRSETGDPIPADVISPDVTGDGTIDLLLLAGPTCPVVTDPPEPGCDGGEVAGATVVIRDAAGSVVTELTSDGAGHARTVLPAGVYVVEPHPVEGLMGTPAAVALWAIGSDVAPFTLAYDTGIR